MGERSASLLDFAPRRFLAEMGRFFEEAVLSLFAGSIIDRRGFFPLECTSSFLMTANPPFFGFEAIFRLRLARRPSPIYAFGEVGLAVESVGTKV